MLMLLLFMLQVSAGPGSTLPSHAVMTPTASEQSSLAAARAAASDMQKLAVTDQERKAAADTSRIIEEYASVVKQRASGRYLQTSVSHTATNPKSLEKQKQLRDQQRAYEMKMLQLQDQLNQISQTYSMISNIMKAKHDAAMAAIQNIR